MSGLVRLTFLAKNGWIWALKKLTTDHSAMIIPGFLKKKSTYIILMVVLIGGYFLFGRGKNDANDQYEIASVERGMLERNVNVTGEIKPAQRIALSFERGGTLFMVHKKVGEHVTAGDLIAELQDVDLQFSARRAQASLAVAQANLNLKLAGATVQAIRVAETDVEKAQASLEKANTDLHNTKITSVIAVQNSELARTIAKKNLDNGWATDAQTVNDAYADLRLALFGALGPMQSAMSAGDAIIGVDDTATNATYKTLIGIGDSGAVTRADTAYRLAKPVKLATEKLVRALTSASSTTEINVAATAVQQSLMLVQTYLTEVQKVLSASISGGSLSETSLASMKAQTDADRTAISTQKATIENAVQATVSAQLGRTTSHDQLMNAYDTAELNVVTARANAETGVASAEANVTIGKAALAGAKAILEQTKAGPRAVDLASSRATVAEARVAAEQAESDLKKLRVIAPVNGVVSEIVPTVGEQIAANAPAIRIIGEAGVDIETLIPEADIAKVMVGQGAKITLDAYGDNVTFEGTVVSEEPDQTVVQDAVYYKARIQIITTPEQQVELKPGMTANVTINTARVEQALIIPSRAVRTDGTTGEQSLRILDAQGKPQDRKIKTGLRGDEGRVSVVEGVQEGEKVIVSEKTQ